MSRLATCFIDTIPPSLPDLPITAHLATMYSSLWLEQLPANVADILFSLSLEKENRAWLLSRRLLFLCGLLSNYTRVKDHHCNWQAKSICRPTYSLRTLWSTPFQILDANCIIICTAGSSPPRGLAPRPRCGVWTRIFGDRERHRLVLHWARSYLAPWTMSVRLGLVRAMHLRSEARE